MKSRNPEMFRSMPLNSFESESRKQLKLAYEKAKKVLDLDRIKVEDHRQEFDAIYGSNAVTADMQEVARLKKKFQVEGETESKMLSIVLEAIIHEQIEQNEWLGPGARTIKPSDYDDIMGGIDEIVEFPYSEDSLYTGLAIDATTGTLEAEKKLKRIRNEIDIGILPAVKYGYSEHNSFHGELPNIPLVIIEVRPETTKQLMNLWVEGKNATLARHPIRIQILREIALQSTAFADYAKSKKKIGLVRVYEALANKINQVLSEQQGENPTPKDDGSVFNLGQDLDNLFRKAA